MDLYIDEKSASADFIAGKSLNDALRLVQSDYYSGDRLVVRIACNGCDVAADDMEQALRRPADSYDRLDVYTNTRGELVANVMTEASASLQETDRACREAGDLLSRGRTAEGIEALGECLAVWQQIHDAVGKSIQLLGIDTERVYIQDEPMSVVLGKPKDILTQVKQALEARDMILLADLLMYDLSEVTGQWLSIVRRLREEADEI